MCDMLDSDTGIVLVGDYYYSPNSKSAARLQLMELDDAGDVRVVHSRDLSFSVKDDMVLCTLPDGSWFTSESDVKPRWVMNRNNDARVAFLFEQMGVKSFPSSQAIEIAGDKALAQAMLAGTFPSLDCALVLEREVEPSSVKDRTRNGYPYVLKTVSGYGGTGVHMIESDDDFNKVMDANQYKLSKVMAQSACDRGDDIRVYLIGDRVMNAVIREVSEGQWKANLKFAPKHHVIELSGGERQLIEKASQKIPGNNGLTSIDLLVDNGKFVLCEINTNPAIDALCEAGCGDGFMKQYVNWLNEQ